MTSPPRKRRVLVAIESLARGGAERLLVTTLAHIDRSRFEPEVAALFGPAPLAAEIRALGVPVHEMGLSGPRDLLTAAGTLRRMLRDGEFDLLHTHLFTANVAGRLAAGRRVPVITTLHNPDYGAEGPSHGLGLRRLIDGSTAHLFRPTYLAVSEDVRADYRRQLGLGSVRVLHNYMDFAAFRARLSRVDPTTQRREMGIAADAFIVLHAGRLHPQKGHDVLIPAFARLRRARGRAHLVLAGEGPERATIESSVARHHLSDSVTFVGSVADVVPLYAAADVFAFPSRYEAFGVALLEAMAAGLPTVVSRVGGILEVATSGSSLFVDPTDEVGLYRALQTVFDDPALGGRLGDGGVRRALDFDVARLLPELERMYDAA